MPIADRKEVEEKLEIFYRNHRNELSKYVAPSMKEIEGDVIKELENVSYDVVDIIYRMYDEEKESLESSLPTPFIYDKAGPACIAGAVISIANIALYGHGLTVASSSSLDFERSLEYKDIGCTASEISKVKRYVLEHAYKMLEDIKIDQTLQNSVKEKQVQSFKRAGIKHCNMYT